MRMWTRICFATAIVVTCAGVAGPAEARPLDHFKYVTEYHPSDAADFCGADMPLRVDYTATGTVTGRLTGGRVRYIENLRAAETWTNVATGRAITNVFHVVQQDLRVSDNGDGTMSVVYQVAGHDKIYGPDGEYVAGSLGAGNLRHLLIIDFNGTWTDPSDDMFISETPLTNHGPGADVDDCVTYRNLTS